MDGPRSGARRGARSSSASPSTRIVVEAPIERAFSVFTEQFDSIKPWQIESDLEKTSEVEVRLMEAGRDGVGSEGGWPVYLQRFAELLED